MGTTVEELLCRVSSYELTEWMAFERANGPLGHQYSDDMLAHLHEQLQVLTYLTAQINYGDENPVPSPVRLKRPHEVLKVTDYDLDFAEFNASFDDE